MISFKKYYLQQFKDVPFVWKLAKRHKKYGIFFMSVLPLMFPTVIFTMWLYDTRQIEIDKRFCKKQEK